MHQYSVNIHWDEDDQIFIGEVPELVDCTASGTTHEAALQAVHQAVAVWIESARDAGHPIPEPQSHLGDATKKKGRGGRRQERIEKRRRQREQGRHNRRESS